MPRVKRGVTALARHKKFLRQEKGFRGRRGKVGERLPDNAAQVFHGP